METKGEGERGRDGGKGERRRRGRKENGRRKTREEKSGRGRQEKKEENRVGTSLHYPPLLIYYSL